jgi:hypothetical protein
MTERTHIRIKEVRENFSCFLLLVLVLHSHGVM